MDNGTALALTLLHVATGAFFTATGIRKTFDPDTHAKVTGLFRKLGVGNRFVEWAVPLGELAGGLGVLTGTLTRVAAAGLFLITAGAYYLDIFGEVKAKQPHGLCDWVSKCLCTPEAQLMLILAALMLSGAGPYSLDALLWK